MADQSESVDLQAFVAETIRQVVHGIIDAQQDQRCKDAGGIVSPGDVSYRGNTAGSLMNGEGRPVHEIEFDVAVTVSRNTEASGKVGVVAWAFSLGGARTSQSTDAAVNRIRFKVPVQLPPGSPLPKPAEFPGLYEGPTTGGSR